MLYGALVAASEKGSVAALADVLNVDINGLCEALSVAVRLGFGQRLPPVHGMSLQQTGSLYKSALTMQFTLNNSNEYIHATISLALLSLSTSGTHEGSFYPLL